MAVDPTSLRLCIALTNRAAQSRRHHQKAAYALAQVAKT
jgi:hypothetical protein